jgi:hypothetical protein
VEGVLFSFGVNARKRKGKTTRKVKRVISFFIVGFFKLKSLLFVRSGREEKQSNANSGDVSKNISKAGKNQGY